LGNEPMISNAGKA